MRPRPMMVTGEQVYDYIKRVVGLSDPAMQVTADGYKLVGKDRQGVQWESRPLSLRELEFQILSYHVNLKFKRLRVNLWDLINEGATKNEIDQCIQNLLDNTVLLSISMKEEPAAEEPE